MLSDADALQETLLRARQALLDARSADGVWEGELSSSALAVATAVFAIYVFVEHISRMDAPVSDDGRGRDPRNLSEEDRGFRPRLAPDGTLDGQTEKACRRCVSEGLGWLALHQNRDGGWGDTTLSLSNISTTALCWAACAADDNRAAPAYASVVAAAEAWLITRAGGIDPGHLIPAIIARYGKDKTFSVPILTMCALAGRLGQGRGAWRKIPQLPFELAAFPQRWFKWLRLPVVSYALPALIAIGLVRHVNRPGWNLIARLIRVMARRRSLALLERIQPQSGGFLEATPLTSFIVMSLVGAGQATHPVAMQGIEFLLRSARPDGSWPIDTNLATWVTTLAVNALAIRPDFLGAATRLSSPKSSRGTFYHPDDCLKIHEWLLAQQYRQEHPYTLADAGGWAWTPLTGGVPDADDTPGALLALRNLVEAAQRDISSRRDPVILRYFEGSGLCRELARSVEVPQDDGTHLIAHDDSNAFDHRTKQAAADGIGWLLDLQNRDGGIPTFCRGWGRLPFDRSSADLSAHTLRAIAAWIDDLPANLATRARNSAARIIEYLIRTQQTDGSWLPLWFGNQHAPDDVNPTYGTARVLLAAQAVVRLKLATPAWAQKLAAAVDWLLAAQRPGGGFGAGHDTPASIEETALAVEALADILRDGITIGSNRATSGHPLVDLIDYNRVREAVARGVDWLLVNTNRGRDFPPSPIGFYFAKLWYYEKLYPLIFTVAALESAAVATCPSSDATSLVPSPGTPGEGVRK